MPSKKVRTPFGEKDEWRRPHKEGTAPRSDPSNAMERHLRAPTSAVFGENHAAVSFQKTVRATPMSGTSRLRIVSGKEPAMLHVLLEP